MGEEVKFFARKPPPEPVEQIQKLIIIDVWYTDELFPELMQSWTWQTIDFGPDYPRAKRWIENLSEVCNIHHFHIKEFDRPIPNFDTRVVMPIDPSVQ